MKKLIAGILMVSILTGCAGFRSSSTDTQGPYINLETYEFETTIGNPIDFSNISGYDDVDGMVPVYVVDEPTYTEAGEFYPVLSCRDTSGNVTEVPVTVIVREEAYVEQEVQEETKAAAEEEAAGCKTQGAYDSELPCSTVPDAYLEGILKLYVGRSGSARCKAAAGQNGGSCVVIKCNDGSFWGYGLTEKSSDAEDKEE